MAKLAKKQRLSTNCTVCVSNYCLLSGSKITSTNQCHDRTDNLTFYWHSPLWFFFYLINLPSEDRNLKWISFNTDVIWTHKSGFCTKFSTLKPFFGTCGFFPVRWILERAQFWDFYLRYKHSNPVNLTWQAVRHKGTKSLQLVPAIHSRSLYVFVLRDETSSKMRLYWIHPWGDIIDQYKLC